VTLRDCWQVYQLALTLWREARNQPREAIIAAGCSIRNRTKVSAWWNGHAINDYVAVTLFPDQYSCFNHGDANAELLPKSTDPIFPMCLDVAEGVYSLATADVTAGATHYFDSSLFGKPPEWAAEMTFTVQVGAFWFYR
jgi:hypothetical protein